MCFHEKTVISGWNSSVTAAPPSSARSGDVIKVIMFIGLVIAVGIGLAKLGVL